MLINSRQVKTVLQSSRPNFLLLSLVIVLMPISIALYQDFDISWLNALLIVLAAMVAHMAVNLLNEYQDFQSGLDAITDKTPFSGGSGALVVNPDAAKGVLNLFIASMAVLVAIGIYFLTTVGNGVLIFGVTGILLIVFYTKYITKQPWLCLIAPGLAFGPLMIIGSYYALTSEVSLLVVCLSLVPFFLTNNLLLLNQIPDMEADQKVGRFNVLMLLGVEDSLQIFAAFIWLAFIVLGFAIWYFDLSSWVSLGFLSLLVAFPMMRDVQLTYNQVDKLTPVLGMNVIINLLTPTLISIGFLVATYKA